ncbi:LysR family transcriptional regulator [Marinobacter sp.]|uniref:LysR family transcriptional regulator n=1 Tax=Marinobacter sp. TaxID=50741 RepID=UPI002B271EA1|nr:LysR family transcriptional regulator [Marinobacter sp.]
MDDLNDLYFFSAVVQHNGFSAAARVTGVQKTRLSRRVANLEKRLGVRLLHRSTRTMALTEAGERFYEQCVATVEGAQAAYESIADLRKEPAGTVRVSCPVVLAQSYLAPILPGYMALHPKVKVFIEATDHSVNLIEERFDLALRARQQIEDTAGLVAKNLGSARRILVASPAFLDRYGRPQAPSDLAELDTMSQASEIHDEYARWNLVNTDADTKQVQLKPRLISGDLRVQLEACTHGIGIALLPEPIVSTALRANLVEQVLPDWSAPEHIIHLVYPPPRGMLPSVRSLIDYLMIHLPAGIMERNV